MSHNNDYKLNMLLNMGFDNVSKCVQALELSNGDVERAIEFLCNDTASSYVAVDPPNPPPSSGGRGGGGGGRRRTSSRAPAPKIVSCELSQYNVPNGKSACTCIALAGAQEFLKAMDVPHTPAVKAEKEESSTTSNVTAAADDHQEEAKDDDNAAATKDDDKKATSPPPPPPPAEEKTESKSATSDAQDDKNEEAKK
mmetsp:Transcript_4716/g.6440  ORF Transcript_4716/g.6440 Transcript_4716/m.6440 type:complete len:197 (-) Transcript_4716:9-599(-)